LGGPGQAGPGAGRRRRSRGSARGLRPVLGRGAHVKPSLPVYNWIFTGVFMLDAALLRNDLDAVIAGLGKRGAGFDREEFTRLESERRRVIQEAEALKAERNRVSD